MGGEKEQKNHAYPLVLRENYHLCVACLPCLSSVILKSWERGLCNDGEAVKGLGRKQLPSSCIHGLCGCLGAASTRMGNKRVLMWKMDLCGQTCLQSRAAAEVLTTPVKGCAEHVHSSLDVIDICNFAYIHWIQSIPFYWRRSYSVKINPQPSCSISLKNLTKITRHRSCGSYPSSPLNGVLTSKVTFDHRNANEWSQR